MEKVEVVIGLENFEEIRLWIQEVTKKIDELNALLEAKPKPRASAATAERAT